MNSLKVSDNSGQSLQNLMTVESVEKWYTIQDLAELCGFSVDTLKYGEVNLNAIMEKMSINIEVNTRLGGYHNTQKFYSENVLKALKEYQIKNGVSNATKDKETAIQGNVSFIQNQTVKQTINNLLDNPQTLELLLAESLERQKSLQIENKMMKDLITEQKPKVEYVDAYCDSENLEEIGHLGKVTKIGEIKIFKTLLKDGIIKERHSTDGIKCYDPCFGYEKYFETLHVPFLRGEKQLNRDKLMLNHKGFMYFRAKYATEETIAETADKWLEKEGK